MLSNDREFLIQYHIAVLYIGSDHRGFELKAVINNWLSGRGIEFRDMGAFDYDHSDDYVDFAIKVAQEVSHDPLKHRGIVLCGSGVGVDIAANKVNRVRCGLGLGSDQVAAARKDDNVNVLAIAADNTEGEKALHLVEVFLETEFVASDVHLKRIEKIERLEGKV